MPVIAAVNGHCLGGGVGLVGNADCIVASDDAYFGVPEVNQGALGAATHMARLVPQHLMRTLYFTARTVPAAQLVQFGSVLEVVPPERLDDAALAVAAEIAAKDTRVIRAAKEALNGIDPVDVNRSYRLSRASPSSSTLPASPTSSDQFAGTEKFRGSLLARTSTSEDLNEAPRQADEHRRGRRRAEERDDDRHRRLGPAAQADGAGAAILRSDLKDLTLVSSGGADVGLLVRAGKVRRLVAKFVSLDTVPLEPSCRRPGRRARSEGVEPDKGMFMTGLKAAARRLPFL